MRDYWLSKLFFDLQRPALAQQFRADPEAVLKDYPLEDQVKRVEDEEREDDDEVSHRNGQILLSGIVRASAPFVQP